MFGYQKELSLDIFEHEDHTKTFKITEYENLR